jgi:uncharacterized protein
MRRWLACWVAALLLAFGPARAQDLLPVPPLSGRVIDQTGTLSAAQAQALTDKLAALETLRGAKLVVLIVPTTQPEDNASYAQRVADSWKLGRREVGDGLLLVVAKNDRKVRIEVAKALEGAVPDLAAKRIISEQIGPAFKAGDFAGGLNLAVDALAGRIAGEGLPEPEPRGGGKTPGFDFGDLPMFLFVVVPLLGAVLTRVFGRKFGALAVGVAAGGVGWWITASVLAALGAAVVAVFAVGVLGLGAARGRSGLGSVIFGGGHGGFGGGGDGGGFSAGGGGDFGGGGASGDW